MRGRETADQHFLCDHAFNIKNYTETPYSHVVQLDNGTLLEVLKEKVGVRGKKAFRRKARENGIAVKQHEGVLIAFYLLYQGNLPYTF